MRAILLLALVSWPLAADAWPTGTGNVQVTPADGCAASGCAMTGTLNLGNDYQLQLGSTPSYWLRYNSITTQLELYSTDTNGAGADGLVLSVDDGALGVALAGSLTLGADLLLNAGTGREIVFAVDNDPATPSLTLEPGTGLYGSSDGGGSFSVNGTLRGTFSATALHYNVGFAWGSSGECSLSAAGGYFCYSQSSKVRLHQQQTGLPTVEIIGSADATGEVNVRVGSAYTDAQSGNAGTLLAAATDVDGTPVDKWYVHGSGATVMTAGVRAATPAEPFACGATTTGADVYADDTDDGAIAAWCTCVAVTDSTYDWRRRDDEATACPFF